MRHDANPLNVAPGISAKNNSGVTPNNVNKPQAGGIVNRDEYLAPQSHRTLCGIVKVADMKYEIVRKVTRRFKDGSTVTILADGTLLIKESNMDLMSDRKATPTLYTRKAPPPRSKDLKA